MSDFLSHTFWSRYQVPKRQVPAQPGHPAEPAVQGISAAAAEAGIAAALEVLARGGSEQEAWDAACDAAGEERGC